MSLTSSKKYPVSKIILIVWLVFSTLYILYNEYHRLRFAVADVAYNRGVQDTALKLIDQSANCQPIPVVVGQARVDVISISCLQEPQTSPPPLSEE